MPVLVAHNIDLVNGWVSEFKVLCRFCAGSEGKLKTSLSMDPAMKYFHRRTRNT